MTAVSWWTLIITYAGTQLSRAQTDTSQSAALAADDECTTSDGLHGACAVSALQRRAHRMQAELGENGQQQQCSEEGADCRSTGCCADSTMTCYEKNQFWAGCRESCSPGPYEYDDAMSRTPWSCRVIGTEATTSPAPGPEVPSLEPTSGAPAAASPLLPVTSPIIIRGNLLYEAEKGKRFVAKGIAYNPRNINWKGVDEGPGSQTCKAGQPKFPTLEYTADVTADEHEAEFSEALKVIAKLGANTVRLYNVNPSNSHAKFMNLAASLGIYVLVPLTRMDWGFLPAFPSPDCYEKVLEGYGHVGVNLLTSAKLIVQEFSKYTNTLMFVVANELPVNDKNGFAAYPCVKSLTRDIHRYQASCAEGMRRVPLIYADVDMGAPDRGIIAKYMTCELESPDDAVDAYGLNVYSWCDENYLDEHKRVNFRYSPYQAVLDDFGGYDKPLLFTEFGCNTGVFETACPYPKGRTWPDVPHMFKEMAEVLSGAIAFEYSMEKNQFGIVLTPGFLKGQTEVRLLPSFYALQKAFTENHVSSTWDGLDTHSCSALPSDVAPMAYKHARSVCTSTAVARELQTRHGVEKVVDWHVIPPTPSASVLAAWNATAIGCPAYQVSPEEHQESCCHMSCSH
ncbi:unnamed protein product [Polarella glacialis]|uniref:1,3-beta-glucanosyltransferase n=1 Tax=Polarella glacialis TaxID=89957 RepID=A0A813KY22_POLGL|nr:unnamed protein product [Polarella glacialis]